MNRTTAAVLASLLATAACGPAPVPVTPVTIWWEFSRHTFVDGIPDTLPYDPDVNAHPPGIDGPCTQAGVDWVIVYDAAGVAISPFTPCVNLGVQGAVVTGFQGPNTYVVEGWRDGVSVPLYRGQVLIDGLAPPPAPAYSGTAIAAGIPSSLTIDMLLYEFGSPAAYTTCGAANVDGFDGWLEDGAGTLVWRNFIPCQPFEMPSIQYGDVDRDDLFAWIDTYRPPPGIPDIPWSICDYGFGHFRDDLFGLRMDVGACPNPYTPALRAVK
ncbi:MAG: hypothetical protein H6Q88_3633 [Anaeromyxobacteraceae bacterium]|nr:hypothetical protein [Anaeromyxobacteraceae bacterium]